MRKLAPLLLLLACVAPAMAVRPGPVEVRADASCPSENNACLGNQAVLCLPSRNLLVCESSVWKWRAQRVPYDTTAPATCAIGDLWVDSDASANQRLLVCEAANTWRAQGAGGGTGDVTAVGPGCSSGACFTDGVATTGTTMFAWEGNANDSTEWYMNVPLNPAADRTVTFPDASGDVVLAPGAGYPSSQCALWNANGQLIGSGWTCEPTGADRVRIGTGSVTTEPAIPSCSTDAQAIGYDSGSHAFVCGDDDVAVPGGTVGYLQYNDGALGFAASGVRWDSINSVLVTGAIDNLRIINQDINRWKWRLGSSAFDNWTWGAYSFDVEGSSDDTAETTVTFTNPTVDRTITVPDASGTVCLDSGSGCGGGTVTTRRTIGITVDGGASSPATGVKGSTRLAVAGTIKKWTILADAAGSIQFGVWKDTLANYPPTVADSICASACPTLTTDDAAEDSTLAGWTTSVSAGDVIRFNLNSVSTIKWATLIIEVEETL